MKNEFYSYNQDFQTKEKTLETYQEDYKKEMRQRDEDRIKKQTIKNLVWDRWKMIIGILVSLITLILTFIQIFG